jgi:general secretion pathway protein D
MKISHKAWIACVALAVTGVALAQSESVPGSVASGGTPLIQLIDTVAKKTGKSFVIDPHVSGNAMLVHLDPAKIGYPELLLILQVQGYAAIESGGIVRVVPDENARTAPSPLIGGNDKLPDAQMVTRVLRVKSVPATQLVPILRSLLPRSAHFAAVPCTNELVIVDTFANVRRIESIVAAMDKGSELTLPTCRLEDPRAQALAPPAPGAPAPGAASPPR